MDLSLKEAWFSLYAGDFDLVLGQQIVTWGQADGNNPTDNVNPRYVGTRDATTTDEKKIPVPMVNVTWNLPSGDGAVQGLFLPIPAVNRMPDMGDFVKEDIPGVSPENFEGGVRGLFYIGQSSVSVSYLTVLDRYPSDVTGFTRMMVSPMPPPGIFVITSYSIHYTKLYEPGSSRSRTTPADIRRPFDRLSAGRRCTHTHSLPILSRSSRAGARSSTLKRKRP